jgi:hypothetical protein
MYADERCVRELLQRFLRGDTVPTEFRRRSQKENRGSDRRAAVATRDDQDL